MDSAAARETRQSVATEFLHCWARMRGPGALSPPPAPARSSALLQGAQAVAKTLGELWAARAKGKRKRKPAARYPRREDAG